MPDSRIPPKFVPTLTEEAMQDAADALPFVAPGGAVAPAPDSVPPSVDVLRRRRDADAQASGAWAQPTADIADLPTYSGWAQQADAALPLGSGAEAFAAPAQPVVEGSSLPVWMPDQGEAAALPPAGAGAVVDDSDGQPAHSLVQSALGGEGVAVSDATSHLVESAAETAQALEDAITRRVTRRVQETLDARLSAAVLKVVDQQTALLQSSLQLEIDSTIREAVADAVAAILRESRS
ncbi:hypothetical protein GCM10027276_01420 [Comamonas piscis]